jgi:hypothetical protein
MTRYGRSAAGVGWRELALAFAVAVAGCSSPNTQTSGDPGSQGDNGSSGDSTGSGSSSGSASAGSIGGSGSGSGSSGGSGSSSGSSSSGSGSKASDAGNGGGAPDSAGDTLTVPAAGDGMQIVTPPYSASDANAKNMIVNPGQEIFLCYYVTLPNTGEVDVGAFQSFMTYGSSHHFIVFQGGQGAYGAAQPNGTIVPCAFAAGTWVYATSTPGEVVGMSMPDKVGLPFAAGTQLVLNMHFINTGTTPLYPQVKLNILFAKNIEYKAAAMVSFNTQINVPAATATGPGTQTVSGTCTAPAGSNFFIMSTHTHKHATAAVVKYNSGGQSTEIVHTGTATTYPADQENGTGYDWEHPGVGQWLAPNFLTTKFGDSFTYSCSYTNTASTPVTVGETAASNEMCMAIGYYYPAGTSSCN